MVRVFFLFDFRIIRFGSCAVKETIFREKFVASDEKDLILDEKNFSENTNLIFLEFIFVINN